MPKEIYYDTRAIDIATEQQFFHESRAKHADKEIGTNMPQDSEFAKPVKITKIVAILEPRLEASAVALDEALFGDYLKVITEGIVQIQSGNGVVSYYPLSYCLAKNSILGDVEGFQAAAANASFGIVSAQSVNGDYGLAVNIEVPKDQTLKFYLKTKSTVVLYNIRMVLEVETV